MVNIPTDLPLGSGLQMEELITLVPHASLGQDTQDLLIRGLYWAMGQRSPQKEWLGEIFQKAVPDIDDDHKKIVRQSMSWYQNVFARALVTHQVQENNKDVRFRLSEKEATAVRHFIYPNRQTAADRLPNITNSVHYGRQNDRLYQLAYLNLYPLLAAYRDDPQTNWAQELLEKYLLSDAVRTRIVDSVVGHMATTADDSDGAQGATLPALTHWASMLKVLDPSGQTAKRFLREMVEATYAVLFANTAQNVDDIPPELFKEVFPAVLVTVLSHIANGEPIPDVHVNAVEARGMLAEINADIGGKVLGAIGTAFLGWQSYDKAMMKVPGNTDLKLFDVNRPFLSGIGNTFVVVGVIVNMVSVAIAFSKGDFARLPAQKQFALIVQMTQSIAALPQLGRSAQTVYRQVGRLWSPNTNVLSRAAREEAQAIANDEFTTFDVEMEEMSEEVGKVSRKARPIPAVRPASLSKFAKFELTFAAGVAVLAFISSALEAHDEFLNHESSERKGLAAGVALTSGLAAAALAADAAAGVFEVVAGPALLALMPQFALFFAGAGILLSLAMLAFPKKSPADIFMEKFGLPFGKGLLIEGRTQRINPDDVDAEKIHVDLAGKTIHSIDVVSQGNYGIVNLRLYELKNGKVQPIVSRNGRKDGWLTPDGIGEAWKTIRGPVAGLWFTKHENRGIVNINGRKPGVPDWNGWLSNDDPSDAVAESVSEPRVVGEIDSVTVWRRGGYGIVDAIFQYKDRLE